MTNAERQRLAKAISREIVPDLATEVIRRLQVLGIVPSATTTTAEEEMKEQCGSKDPIDTGTDGEADWQARADECGARFARLHRQPSKLPRERRKRASVRAG